MEFIFMAIAFALADAPEQPEPELTVVEEAQRLNAELEELLTHLRSLPAPEEEPLHAENPTQDTATDTAAPPPPDEATAAVSEP